VFMITGFGDHDRPEWLFIITGMRTPGGPIAEPPELAEMQSADGHVVVVDSPSRRNHDQHDHCIRPMDDPER